MTTTMIMRPKCQIIVCICFLLSLLQRFVVTSSETQTQTQTQFVEFYADYKKNHLEDEIRYAYEYYIDHAPTNVHINHREERHGSHVKGQYGLLEPGGNVRHVHYEVDGEKGFRSIINTRTASSCTHQSLQLNNKQPKVPIWHAQPVAFVL